MTRLILAFLALALGVCAVVFLMIPNFAAYANAPAGVALGLLAGLGWAVGTLVMKRRPIDVPVTVFTAWQLIVCGIPILIFALTFAVAVISTSNVLELRCSGPKDST